MKKECSNPPTYCNKFIDPGVVDKINKSRAIVEPSSDIVNDTFDRLTADSQTKLMRLFRKKMMKS